MAVEYKLMGQVGDAITEALLYQVPVGAQAKLKITVANRAGSGANYSVALVPGGGAASDQHWIVNGESLDPNQSLTSEEININGDVHVRVLSSTSTVTFTAQGAERT